MKYKDTLDFLYTKLPMFSRMGNAAFKKDLTNIRILCNSLGNPEKKFKCIHIAGTNGKGSVSHMMAAVLQTEGYKTGLYTSPHLWDFRERIKVNGQMVGEPFVIEFVEEIKPLIYEIEPSFFEITVAMAFTYFAKCNCDIAVIEVGLGGRLDSTNIIEPVLSVITNIGWDHMNMLGNSLEEIAVEKAGIIKRNIPLLIGEKQREVAEVFSAIATQQQSKLYYAADLLKVLSHCFTDGKLEITILDKHTNIQHIYQLDLPGIYQLKNLATAIAACKVLRNSGLLISDDSIHQGIEHTRELTGLHGRWEIIHEHPRVVLEVAHNVNGMKEMLSHLEETCYDQLHIIFGMVKDKDIDPVLKLLPVKANFYFTQANIPRALEARLLQEQALTYHLIGEKYPDVNEAIKASLQKAGKNDLVIVCGSIFLVGEVDRSIL
ncbi:MAG: bifunctional folylpolyglutamate synthase/dihydrofolate synthase [Candidatus Dadabacteria bacterium]